MQNIKLNECNKKKLNEVYLAIYAIKNEVNIKKNDYIEKNDIYTLVGIDIRGYRELINIYQDRPNNNRYWLDCFEALKARGLKKVLFLSVNDNKNIKRTAKIAFPEVKFVDSLTDIVPKFYKHTSEKDAKKLASVLHELYTIKTIEEFKKKFDNFKSIYNNAIHHKLIEKYLSNIENLYKYSVNIRQFLFKHTANIRIYDRIRLDFNYNKSYIENIEEIYDKLGSYEEYFGYTSFKKKEWTLIINDLTIMYPDINLI